MKYYLLILEDSYKNMCGANLSQLSKSILDCVTNGFVQLTPYTFIFKSTQNIKYWEDLIMLKINKNQNEFFIQKIDIYENSGYISKRVWNWIRADKMEIEKNLCKNNFEIESCN